MPQPIHLTPEQVTRAVTMRQQGRTYQQIASVLPCGGTKIREVCIAAIGPTTSPRALYAPKDGMKVRDAIKMRKEGTAWLVVAQALGYSSAKCARQAVANHQKRKYVRAGVAA